MKTKSDILSFIGLLAGFGGQGVIEGFKPEIHDLVCSTLTDCHAETVILAAAKLITGAAGIIAGYYMLQKTSTPPGTNLAVIPSGQAPATVLVDGAAGKGPSYALVNPGSAGEVTPMTPQPSTPPASPVTKGSS